LISRRFFLFSVLVVIVFLTAGFSPALSVSAQDDRGVAIPVLISPHGTILDITPTYKWYKVSGATKYQFQVYRGTTTVMDKIVENNLCGVTYCNNSPVTKLAASAYKWRVRAKINGVWKTWSSYMSFFRSSQEFKSYFTTSMDGWDGNSGLWYFEPTEYMICEGYPDSYTSAIKTGSRYSDFDYLVRIMRESDDPSFLAIRMGPSVGSEGRWVPGYLFGYSNNGTYGIFRLSLDNKVTILQDWTPTTAIWVNNSNLLRVFAKGTTMKYYINGIFLKSINDVTYRNGYVGVMQYTSINTEHAKILIDEAFLYPIKTPQ
jgi:hypothetical protein